MPLRDHFHLPLRGLCTWESFHSGWANEIVRQLNRSLPAAYVARPNVKLGVDVEADVGTCNRELAVPLMRAVELPQPPGLRRSLPFPSPSIFIA